MTGGGQIPSVVQVDAGELGRDERELRLLVFDVSFGRAFHVVGSIPRPSEQTPGWASGLNISLEVFYQTWLSVFFIHGHASQWCGDNEAYTPT